MKTTKNLFLFLLLLITVFSHIEHHTKKQIQQKIGGTKIMYGATIRIRAVAFPFHLHSHHVNYPRGSGYQSVTGFQGDNDYNSLWTIKEPNNQNVKTYYHQLKCGDSIRLEHALTKKNLHSEEIFQSMITNGQQVSAFGSGGQGNDNDNWIIQCLNKQEGQDFYGGQVFSLVHQNTQKKLKMSRYYQYSFSNWQNCPFQGQIQVSATDKMTKQSQFKIVGGVFFKQQKDQNQQNNQQKDQDL